MDGCPRPQVDYVQPNAPIETTSEVKTRAAVWLICPVVIRPIAVIPPGGRPTEVARPVCEVDPRGRVRISRQPYPSVNRIVCPAAIVVRNPAPWLGGIPGQAIIRAVNPTAVIVRTPARADMRTPSPCSEAADKAPGDRKSTRLNSSHQIISYA